MITTSQMNTHLKQTSISMPNVRN